MGWVEVDKISYIHRATDDKVRLFKRFLMVKGLYTMFASGLMREKESNCIKKHFFDYITGDGDGAVDAAFGWSETKEGGDFWCNVDEAWNYFLKTTGQD